MALQVNGQLLQLPSHHLRISSSGLLVFFVSFGCHISSFFPKIKLARENTIFFHHHIFGIEIFVFLQR